MFANLILASKIRGGAFTNRLNSHVVKRARHGVVLGVVLGLAHVVACGGEDPAGPGGTCSLAGDCQSGLICITAKGKGTCSSDLSRVAGEALPDGAAEDPDGAASSEGGVVDSGAPDGGNTPPRDSGSDAGRDSGAGDAAVDG